MLRLMNESSTCVALGRLLDLFLSTNKSCVTVCLNPVKPVRHTSLLLCLVRKPVGQLAHFFHLLSRGSSISVVPSLFIALLMVHTHTCIRIYFNLITIYNLTQGKKEKWNAVATRATRATSRVFKVTFISFLFFFFFCVIVTKYQLSIDSSVGQYIFSI